MALPAVKRYYAKADDSGKVGIGSINSMSLPYTAKPALTIRNQQGQVIAIPGRAMMVDERMRSLKVTPFVAVSNMCQRNSQADILIEC